jgi:membrane protease YdiL (CAAX protease family)
MKMLSVSMTQREKVLGWVYYPIQLLIIPMLIGTANQIIGAPLSEARLNFVYFAVNFLLVAVIFFHFLKGNGKNAIRQPLNCLWAAAVGLILYWGLSYAVQMFITVVQPDFFNVNDVSIGAMVQEDFGLMAIGTALFVPIAEESLYRGVMFSSFYNRSPVAAYVISICIFAAVHVIGYIGSYQPLQLALCFIQYLPAGLALGWAYVKADSIWAPILMHITINAIGVASMR